METKNIKMETLPTEILAHVFEQLTKCEICQKNCLRTSCQALQMCSDTCARWSNIIEGYQFRFLSDSQYWEETRTAEGQLYYMNRITKTTHLRAQIMQQHNIEKCFPDYNDIISVTIDMKNAKSLGLKVLNLMQTFSIDFLNKRGLIIHSIDQAGPVALDGKIKGLDENWIGNSILQVNGIDLKFPMTFADALRIIKDVVENPKFQTVQLIINQNVNISGYIRYGCHGNYNQYPI